MDQGQSKATKGHISIKFPHYADNSLRQSNLDHSFDELYHVWLSTVMNTSQDLVLNLLSKEFTFVNTGQEIIKWNTVNHEK